MHAVGGVLIRRSNTGDVRPHDAVVVLADAGQGKTDAVEVGEKSIAVPPFTSMSAG